MAVGGTIVDQMAESADAHSTDAACMRCGHDLRGIVLGWAAECPLAGTCTECGLGFQWGEVLSPDLRMPNWNLETRSRAWWWPMRWIGHTWMVLVRPRRTFELLSMQHAFRWRRLLAGLVPWILLLMLLGGVPVLRAQRAAAVPWGPALVAAMQPWSERPVRVEAAYRIEGTGSRSLTPTVDVLRPGLQSIDRVPRSLLPEDLGAPVSLEDLAASEPLPVLPTGGMLRGVHHVQSATGPILVGAGWGSDWLKRKSSTFKQPIIVQLSGPAPIDSVPWLDSRRVAAARSILLIPIVAGLTFLLLPDTRRGGKVRLRHVGRLTLYGLLAAIPVAIVAGAVVPPARAWLVGTGIARPPIGPNGYPIGWLVALQFVGFVVATVLPLWVWTGRWCVVAARRHLRLGPARTVGLTVAFTASLAAAVSMALHIAELL